VPLQRVPINNFRGGLNTRDGPFDLQPNESPDLQNVTVSDLVGQLRVRKGKTQFDNGTVTGHSDHMQQIVLSTSIRWIMMSVNGAIRACSMSGAVQTLYTGTAGTVWCFSQYPDATGADKVWMMNGTDPPQKWDGVASVTSAWAGTPPAGNLCKVFGNRMFVIGVAATPQRAFFSPYGDPEATTAPYGYIDMRGPEDELDYFIDMGELGTRLYLFKRESVWVMNDSATMANRRLGRPGVAGRFMLCEMNAKLYWFNQQGLWSTAGVAIAYESGSINNWFPTNLNYAAVASSRLLSTRDSYQRMFLAVATNTSVNQKPNVIIEYVPNINFRRIGGRRYLLLPAFFIHTIPIQAMCNVNTTGTSAWQVVGSAADVTKLYTLFSGQTDDGAAISGYWKSSWMAIQGEEPFERIRRCNVELYGDCIVDIYKDFNITPDFSATLPNPAVSGDNTWDNPPNVWDTGIDVWDPPNEYRFARVRPESRGRFHQVQFRTLPGGIPFYINVAEFAVRGGKEH